ncbi:Arylsulfatase [Caulifigura coniformis]|uniref:Arylsulfatase n=1 Tax=Caulifigura coniformis TaxID=2527983 RepID=A0A517SAP2_9PLAN|nr:sulfatase [Caulifigura coniformis]QDT53189.1 Arylsulfatase [Caulifigura coniformis]
MFRVLTALTLSLLLVAPAANSFAADRPNVLMIAVDDLNHWVGHLGRNKQTQTPNLDALAARGVTFTHAYCAAPACNPSRAALMTGIRPSTSGVYYNSQDWRPHIAPEKTLNATFKAAGYNLYASGKIYHGGYDRKTEWDDYLKPSSDPRPKPGQNDGVGGIKFAPLDCNDEDLEDWKIADYAIERIGQTHDKPFFIACGFHKPHMPWNVPQKYYDKFPLASIELPPYQKDDLKDVPAEGVKMAKPDGDHRQMVESGRWKEAVQAYLATINYLDMNVGRVIAALDKSPYRDNTIIVLWGDHGWHLGEKDHWRKFALWEEACRMPFIWVAPGVTKAGGVCSSPVDLMSVYPTLCELASITKPEHVEGVSVKPLLSDPKARWEHVALTTHGFKNHSIRTEAWRYIQYVDGSEELYDHLKGDDFEWTNVVGDTHNTRAKIALAANLPQTNAEGVAASGSPNGGGGGKRQGQRRAKKAAAND